MIVSINAIKAFEKFHHSFVVKINRKKTKPDRINKNRKALPQIDKRATTEHTILNGKRLNASPHDWEQNKNLSFHHTYTA